MTQGISPELPLFSSRSPFSLPFPLFSSSAWPVLPCGRIAGRAFLLAAARDYLIIPRWHRKNNNIEVAPLYFQCHISFATRWCQPHGLLGMDSYIKDIIQAPILYGKCKKKCQRNEIIRPKSLPATLHLPLR